MRNKLSILVLAGGDSGEREVSLASARAITEAIIKLGYQVYVIDSANGRSLLDNAGKFILQPDNSSRSKLAMIQTGGKALAEILPLENYKDCDLVFIALHGGAGEDGTLQAVLDLAGMRYTGSGQLASALAMNKAMSKKILKNENIPTPDWLLLKVNSKETGDLLKQKILSKFTLPFIIKPNNSGSTIGLTLVRKTDEINSALETALKISDEILVENYIKGREITCAVLNGEPLPLVEIIPTGELYDYTCKYTKGKSDYICPAKIDNYLADEIRQYAVKAYEVINCRGLIRVDFLLDEENRPYFLEVNTLPGMTELSLAPQAAKEAGIDFDRLIEKICQAALD